MRRLMLLPLLPFLFAALVWADDSASRAQANRARQWQRNRSLIQELVQGGLRLAAEDEAVKRAGECSGLAKHLVVAIRQASSEHEVDRVVELGQHLQTLLEEGVAATLNTAGRDALPGSSLADQVFEIQKRTSEVMRPLEDELDRVRPREDREAAREALRALRAGRATVERVQAPR